MPNSARIATKVPQTIFTPTSPQLLTKSTGISYNSRMFLCVECQMLTCTSCHDRHERTHIQHMLRFELLQWMPKLRGVTPQGKCHVCADEFRTRWECRSCARSMCRKCAGQYDHREKFFRDHLELCPEGRQFFATYPPYWTTSERWVHDPCPCLNPGPISGIHCDSCHRGKSCFICFPSVYS